MQGIIYEEASFWQFFFVTCLLGGWAASTSTCVKARSSP